MKRIGLVVHPTREIGSPLATLTGWAAEREIDVVQLPGAGSSRVVAPPGEVDACDLVVAIGGDGTVLIGLREAAAHGTPVLGVACGSLGALSAVTAPQVGEALDRFQAGSWSRRAVPALEAKVDGEVVAWAINDFVLVRRSGGQLMVDVAIGDELYVRAAGDGVIAATSFGSSAYSMAAGGPVLVDGTQAMVVTPLVMHGGSAPPVVVRDDVEVTLEAHPGYGGFDVEVDGHGQELDARTYALRLVESRATLVSLGDPGLGLNALRQRGLITDSPRVLAQRHRTAET